MQERQSFFNIKYSLETQIQERNEIIQEKDHQIEVMRQQLGILIDESEDLKMKLTSKQDTIDLISGKNIVKKIRGGGGTALSSPKVVEPSFHGIRGGGLGLKSSAANITDCLETAATDVLTGRLSNYSGFQAAPADKTPFGKREPPSPAKTYRSPAKPSRSIVTTVVLVDERVTTLPSSRHSGEDGSRKPADIEEHNRQQLARLKRVTSPRAQQPGNSSRREGGIFGQIKNLLGGM